MDEFDDLWLWKAFRCRKMLGKTKRADMLYDQPNERMNPSEILDSSSQSTRWSLAGASFRFLVAGRSSALLAFAEAASR